MLGIVFGKDPAVVFIAGNAVGHRSSIAQKHILTHIITDDATIEPAKSLIGAHNSKRAVLNLLEDIVAAIGLVNLHIVILLVDGSYIDFRMESLVGQSQNIGLARLRFDT